MYTVIQTVQNAQAVDQHCFNLSPASQTLVNIKTIVIMPFGFAEQHLQLAWELDYSQKAHYLSQR